MHCKDCARYDSESRKCLDAKVNPHSWEIAVTVSQVLGLRSICVFNDHRERLVRSRMPQPEAIQKELLKRHTG